MKIMPPRSFIIRDYFAEKIIYKIILLISSNFSRTCRVIVSAESTRRHTVRLKDSKAWRSFDRNAGNRAFQLIEFNLAAAHERERTKTTHSNATISIDD